MKIDVLCSDGSPLGVGVSSIYGDKFRLGVGGAEMALLTMCETWHKAGYDVRLYNDPHPGVSSPFAQLHKVSFDPHDDRDVLIIFRSPNPIVLSSNGLKVWWSCDQYTQGSFRDFAPMVDKIVCISPFHVEYFEKTYGIKDAINIDLPVRIDDYLRVIEKVPNRFLFSSVPDRGLEQLWRMWPRIKEILPDATLTITSDYRLWGHHSAANEQHKSRWLVRDSIFFLGALPRERLVDYQLQAEYHLYPCIYDELFCISVAESQVAGAYTLTSGCGALPTTNMLTTLLLDAKDPRNDVSFISTLKSISSDRLNTKIKATENRISATYRFDPENIFKQWEEKVFK